MYVKANVFGFFGAYVKGGTKSSCLSQKGSYKKYKHIKDDFPFSFISEVVFDMEAKNKMSERTRSLEIFSVLS